MCTADHTHRITDRQTDTHLHTNTQSACMCMCCRPPHLEARHGLLRGVGRVLELEHHLLAGHLMEMMLDGWMSA